MNIKEKYREYVNTAFLAAVEPVVVEKAEGATYTDEDGRAFLYRELYQTKRLVEDHAREIVGLSTGETTEASVSDHDAEDRETLHRHEVITNIADKRISLGIECVTTYRRISLML